MQGVAHFMEHGRHFIEGEQHWLTRWRLWDIKIVDDHRQLPQQPRLIGVVIHPGAALLVAAGKIIRDKKSQRFAVDVSHFKNTHVGTIQRQIGTLFEGHAKKFMGSVEHAVVQDAIEFEVGFDFGLVKIIGRLTHLLGVKIPVPGL